ncbi:hypothetical protein DM01DRAFT_1340035 [Hesseltinella vesiculosa]|uniref:Uncharacterized protein n=1 Tax=Hesseltinella vesiculosa TaxID=101127 RepID=A0A1X2G5G2_9FUNG|nr:hypothetical protein DM01DRAFT_1340035 [Hesseltinella vesiculosa]
MNFGNELLTFRLPWDELPGDELPGGDRLSKIILKSQSAINIISQAILDVPADTYTITDGEWPTGLRSDVVYEPHAVVQEVLPPIIVEVQSIVDEKFMTRLVKYCQFAYDRYGMLPIAFIICVGKVLPAALLSKFTPHGQMPWLSVLGSSDFWAKGCYMVTNQGPLQDIRHSPGRHELSPLQALSLFLLERSPTLHTHSHSEDPTVIKLYTESRNLTDTQEQHHEQFKEVIDVVSYNNTKIIEKADAALNNVPGSEVARHLLAKAIAFNAAVKRKYLGVDDSDDDLEPLPAVSFQPLFSSDHDDIRFVATYREMNPERINSKRCLDEAHRAGRCKTITTSAGLRTFYNRKVKK